MDTSIEEEDDIDQAEQIKASSDSQETSKGKASVSIEVDWEELSLKNLEHEAPISSINHAMHKCSSEFLVSTGALEVFFTSFLHIENTMGNFPLLSRDCKSGAQSCSIHQRPPAQGEC